MKRIFFLLLLLTVVGVTIFISCKKEYSCEGCRDGNKPPIAKAGPDQVITLPTDSVSLDGSASSDPDGTISSYQWTKISGPASFTIITASAARTSIKQLVMGVYRFELKVTDNGGLSAKDTVQIVVTDSTQPNRPPVAKAGADQTITLPTNTINLDGSGSTDPDNNITSYAWTKIAGSSSYNITNANTMQTPVTNLIQGVYQFELKVTDAGGLFSKDTIQLTVNPAIISVPCNNSNRPTINAQLIPIGTLSQTREGIAVASAGNKILFAGGHLSGNPVSRVDIYNLSTNTWSTAELCAGRYAMASVALGNKIFFAGGETGDGTWPVDSVDIYDVSTNTWAVTHLSTAGNSIAAAAVGNKVLFAGGDGGFSGSGRERRVDIYDLSTNAWTTSSLSEVKRGEHAAVTLNNKVYFAGGETWPAWPNGSWGASDKIDIYDNITNSWSVSNLNVGRFNLLGIAISDKIYWAGGQTGWYPSLSLTCSVEIQNVNTGSSSTQYLFNPSWWWNVSGQNAVVKDNKIIFYRAQGSARNKFDIYDIVADSWSIGILQQPIPEDASIISVNNTIYVAGGLVNGVRSDKVWKLEF